MLQTTEMAQNVLNQCNETCSEIWYRNSKSYKQIQAVYHKFDNFGVFHIVLLKPSLMEVAGTLLLTVGNYHQCQQ